MDIAYLGTVLLLVVGFGFVIFFHELGHFLAAKWAGVKVEQFAVGFGQAIFCWRKGLGFRWGSSREEFEMKLSDWLNKNDASPELAGLSSQEQLKDLAARKLGVGETEYRLNWVPLGGYVKMLGQDDLNPNALSDSPRAFNNKPVGERMVIVSAGVIMNVILAVILFTALFRIGFNAPPAVVGLVLPGSPAQQAGLQVGDRILYFGDRFQHDFTKVHLSVALAEEDRPTPVRVRRLDGSEATLNVVPRRSSADPDGFLQLGIASSFELRGPDPENLTSEQMEQLAQSPLRPGEKIVAINGEKVGLKDYPLLDRAVQNGRAVQITVEDRQGKLRQEQVIPAFLEPFGMKPLNFAGMTPRVVVAAVQPRSSALGRLQAGDVIDQITIVPANDTIEHPSRQQIIAMLNEAGQHGLKVDLVVIRHGQPVRVDGLDPSVRITRTRKGLGIELETDTEHPVIAQVLPDSAAERAGLPSGATIRSIAGQPVESWRDVQRILSAASADQSLAVVVITRQGQEKSFELKMTEQQLAEVRNNRYFADLALHGLEEPRKTTNPVVAATWGLVETRDLIVQFYLTIRRMIQGSVSPSAAMGPIGIFYQGSKIAYRGTDWFIWYLAMLSANLAVVNFLPIPIVDGGLFMFLILEKLTGRPLSPRMQSIAQIVGLALIAGVFLFVTYHDISRLIF